jgi:hypothetical protein
MVEVDHWSKATSMTTLLRFTELLVRFGAVALMWAGISIFLLKTVWNVTVPYAMIREARRRDKEPRGWSLFFLIDVILAVFVVGLSFVSGQSGYLGPLTLTKFAIVAILAGFVHLILIMLVGGLIFGLFPPGNDGINTPVADNHGDTSDKSRAE